MLSALLTEMIGAGTFPASLFKSGVGVMGTGTTMQPLFEQGVLVTPSNMQPPMPEEATDVSGIQSAPSLPQASRLVARRQVVRYARRSSQY